MQKLLAAIFCLCASPAFSTSAIYCTNPDESASISVGFGTLPVAAIVSTLISAPDAQFATFETELGPANLEVGQAFFDDGTMRIDYVDPNFEAVIAKLRLFSADAENDYVLAGTLEVEGVGAYPMICDGP